MANMSGAVAWIVGGVVLFLSIAGLAACSRGAGRRQAQGVGGGGHELASLAKRFRARGDEHPVDNAMLDDLAAALATARPTRTELLLLLGGPAWSVPLERGMAVEVNWRATLPPAQALDLLSYACGQDAGASLSFAVVVSHGGDERVVRAGVWHAYPE